MNQPLNDFEKMTTKPNHGDVGGSGVSISQPLKEKLNSKIEEILNEPMKLDFIPQYRKNLKEIIYWYNEQLVEEIELYKKNQVMFSDNEKVCDDIISKIKENI